MRVIAVDDYRLLLEGLTRMIGEAKPTAECAGFASLKEALGYAKAHRVDVAFVDVDSSLYTETDAMLFAEVLQELNSRTNIIFTSVMNDAAYLREAFRLHASGSLLKPFSRERLAREFEHLRYPVV